MRNKNLCALSTRTFHSCSRFYVRRLSFVSLQQKSKQKLDFKSTGTPVLCISVEHWSYTSVFAVFSATPVFGLVLSLTLTLNTGNLTSPIVCPLAIRRISPSHAKRCRSNNSNFRRRTTVNILIISVQSSLGLRN